MCYWGVNSISTNVDDEKLDRILDIWDWLLSDEGMNFRMYGFEGKDFVKTGDGIELLWSKNDLGNYVDPYPQGCRGFYERPILNDAEIAYTKMTIPEADRREGNNAWRWDWENAHIGKVDYNMLYSSIPNKDALVIFVSDVKAKSIELLMNSTQTTIEDDWKAWTDSMMPKVQLVLDDLNNLPYIPSSYEDLLKHMGA